QAGEKLHRRPEPAERNGRVEYCAAGIGRECRFVGRGTARQHVDEGFAAAKDHESKLQSGYSTAAAGLANSPGAQRVVRATSNASRMRVRADEEPFRQWQAGRAQGTRVNADRAFPDGRQFQSLRVDVADRVAHSLDQTPANL